MILCGITVPSDVGLDGHSDADVGIHALCDAIYGALAEGDIGRHFPPTEADWKDADSARFLRHAAERIAARGGFLANADVTLICERPKITPHAPAMRARLAELLGVSIDAVSVKGDDHRAAGISRTRRGNSGAGGGVRHGARVETRLLGLRRAGGRGTRRLRLGSAAGRGVPSGAAAARGDDADRQAARVGETANPQAGTLGVERPCLHLVVAGMGGYPRRDAHPVDRRVLDSGRRGLFLDGRTLHIVCGTLAPREG